MPSIWKNEESAAGRCINIDWLECYCLENYMLFPCNADFFRRKGWQVVERDYGTRQYQEMFTILDEHGCAFIEVRRHPVAAESNNNQLGIFSEYSCHLRLSNRYCYHNRAIELFTKFCHDYEYEIRRIFRLDLALDFELFDKGDDPHKFLLRYLAGRYSKINQSKWAGRGDDRWDGRDCNSISWGSLKSMVSTKFYNKTRELKEVKDKPYIRYAWLTSHLIDALDGSKKAEDGTVYYPTIWRVEFSIKGNAHAWYKVENCNGNKTRTEVRNHALGDYATKLQQLEAFAYLAHHYFHFKKYQEGVRKDRCEDKVLFDFGLTHEPYKLDVLLSDRPTPTLWDTLIAKLKLYASAHPSLAGHCNAIIEDIRNNNAAQLIPGDFDKDTVIMLRQLMALRSTQDPKEPLEDTKQRIQLTLTDMF